MAFSTLGKQIRRPGECASQGYLSESVRKTKVHGWRGAGQDFTEVGLWGSPIAASPSPIEKAGTQMVCQHCPGMSWNGLLFPHPDQSYRSWAAPEGRDLGPGSSLQLSKPWRGCQQSSQQQVGKREWGRSRHQQGWRRPVIPKFPEGGRLAWKAFESRSGQNPKVPRPWCPASMTYHLIKWPRMC